MEAGREPDFDPAEADAALRRAGATNPCPACNNSQWELDAMRWVMQGLSHGTVIGDLGYAVLIVRCARCGFVRLHSTSKLGL